MQFQRTRDMGLVRSVLAHPRLWDSITDDFCPSREEFQPVDHDLVWYVGVYDGEEFLGLWMCVFLSPILVDIHTALLPAAWGTRGKIAALEMSEWLFTHSTAKRIITVVPSYNRLALRFAKRAGMVEFGRDPRSYQKNGVLHDRILLGISASPAREARRVPDGTNEKNITGCGTFRPSQER